MSMYVKVEFQISGAMLALVEDDKDSVDAIEEVKSQIGVDYDAVIHSFHSHVLSKKEVSELIELGVLEDCVPANYSE